MPRCIDLRVVFELSLEIIPDGTRADDRGSRLFDLDRRYGAAVSATLLDLPVSGDIGWGRLGGHRRDGGKNTAAQERNSKAFHRVLA